MPGGAPPQVFRNPYEVVTVLLIQTLGAMVPGVPVCLSSALEHTPPEQRLDSLLELHHTATAFGRSLEGAMLPHLGEIHTLSTSSQHLVFIRYPPWLSTVLT